jgi:hypothetical protein
MNLREPDLEPVMMEESEVEDSTGTRRRRRMQRMVMM